MLAYRSVRDADRLAAEPIAGNIRRTTLLTLALMLAGVFSARAQADPPTKPDSVDRVRLGDIVVSGSPQSPVITTYTEERIRLAAIARRDPAVVSDIATLIPSAHIQTNSRGETLVYLRNAGERQVGIFFEGALINIPWDNRIDLSLIPASVMGGLTVAKGVPPVEYGANVLGGAINFTTRPSFGDGSETEIAGMFGSQSRVQGALTHRGWAGRVSYTGAVSYTRSDGIPVAGNADLPHSQVPGELRTNTDSRALNLFANGVYNFDNGNRLGLTVAYVDAEKGVAPESNLDPSASNVRFWRYPTWRNLTVIASGDGYIGRSTWKVSTWVTSFEQDIDSYTSGSYDQLESQEQDQDLTLGARGVSAIPIGSGTGKLAINWLTSEHGERDVEPDVSGGSRPEDFPKLEYQQHLLSLGAEYGVRVSPFIELSAGASFDAQFMPKTGDKPARDPFTDYSLTVGATWDPSPATFLRFAAGRKTRFPTMRELFGVALNRFLLNPSLQPESSFLAEIGVGVAGAAFSAEAIPFVNIVSNTIDQRSVLVDPGEPTKRQRINLVGSRVFGLELVGSWIPADHFSVDGHLTLTNVRRRGVEPGEEYRLSERPEALGRLAAGYSGTRGTSVFVEGVYTGRAYSPDDQNNFVELPRSVAINLRLAQTFTITPAQEIEVFARADNINDALVIPQLGLPAAGRAVTAGVSVDF